MTPGAARPRTPADRWRLLGAIGVVAATLAGLGALATIGGPHGPLSGLAATADLLIRAGAAPAAYILGALGLGRLAAPLLVRSRDPLSLQLALGLALMLSLSHLLGWIGAFGSGPARLVALGVPGIGLLLLARQAARSLQRAPMHVRVPWAALLAVPGAGAMLVAACNPPGWLWASEAHGYDALEYHLQLPQGWLALGRLAPLEHNVFSFLPGYVEAAFYQLAVMMGAPAQPPAPGQAFGLLAGDGSGLIAAQLLHAGLGLGAAILVGRAARLAARRAGARDDVGALAGALAGALFISIPWVIVTGSLAYNEMALLALFAGALIAAMDEGLGPGMRGLLTGLLIGVACGAKPSALVLAGAPAGVMLLGVSPVRQWPRLAGFGAAAGVVALAPWLVRNWLASGNPVFPHLPGVFGTAHWTADQAERYLAAVGFDGSLADRLRLMVLPDTTDPAGPRHRGLLHPQWSIFWPVIALAAIAALCRPAMRRHGAILAAAIIAGLLAWLLATHIQSRFLVPLAAPGAILFGLAAIAFGARSESRAEAAGQDSDRTPVRAWPARLAIALGGLVALIHAAHALLIFGSERGGHPNALLLAGPGALSGEPFREQMRRTRPQEALRLIHDNGPTWFANLVLRPGSRLYLLGDATPLYYTVPVLYHTPFDRSPLGQAMRDHPNEPAAWTDALRRRGVTHVLLNLSEIERLHRSGRPGLPWYDPLVTADAAERWLLAHGPAIAEWPERGLFLYDLRRSHGGPP